MADWFSTVIPNPIDTSRWQPIDQRLARQLLGLPQDCNILLFGAIGGGNDPRKGIELLRTALAILSDAYNFSDLHLVVFGQAEPRAHHI